MLLKDSKEVENRKEHGGKFRRIRAGCLLAACLLLVAAAFAAAGFSRMRARAVEKLQLVTNAGIVLNSQGYSLKVMDGAEIYIKDYDSENESIYYKLYDSPIEIGSGFDFSSVGTRYTGNAITLTKSASQDGIRYLYIQVDETDSNNQKTSSIMVFYVQFYEKLEAVASTPPTSDTDMTAVKVGDTIRLSSDALSGGALYYTIDGTTPAFKRDEDGDILVNNERFSAACDEEVMLKYDMNTGIVVPYEWAESQSRTIRVAAYLNGMDFSPVTTLRFKVTLDQASAPSASPAGGTTLSMDTKIYLNTGSASGVILYTTDGTTPSYTVSGSSSAGYSLTLRGSTRKYENYILTSDTGVSRGSTLVVQAKTVCVDMQTGQNTLEDSKTVSFSFPVEEAQTVSAPTATPATSYNAPVTVSAGDKIILSSATSGATIYYTTDGTAPVAGADNTSVYSGSITVPEGSGYFTVTAMAGKEGMTDSGMVQFVYQYAGTVSPPYVSPVEGTVSINTQVTLASLDKDAQILYTTDGTDPTATSGILYSSPILITQDTIIKAIAVVNNVSSAVKTFTFYAAAELTAPSPSIASGSVVTSGTILTLTAQSGAVVYYTTDGTSPKLDSAMTGNTAVITGQPGETVTVMTYAAGSNYSDSQVATYVYMISNYENGVRVNRDTSEKVQAGDVLTLETDVTNGTIYYAVGDQVPSSGGAAGTSVIVGDAGDEEKFTLRAVAVVQGSTFLNTFGTFIYEYMDIPAAPKASIPNGAVLLENKDIALTAESGDIYYTLDGTEPDELSNLYTEPISVTQPTTIKAVAISEEGAASRTAAFAYTFADQVEAPVFSIGGGEVDAGAALTIVSATEGATIYYTTDGTAPDPDNTKNLYVYSGAIALNKAVNIKAIAVKDRMSDSEVTSAIYTVREPVIQEDEEAGEEEKSAQTDGRLVSRRSYMDSSSGPTYSDFVLKSAATGAVVSAGEDAIPAETVLEVQETAVEQTLEHAVQSSVGSGYSVAASYEVTLTRDGEAVQPEGPVELGLPIPSGYRNSVISIGYVDDDGNVELFDTRRDDDMVYAFVDHFSRYCIVVPVYDADEAAGLNMTVILAGLIAVLLAGGYVFLRLSRKKKEERP